jgi:hypothetical protein
MQYYTSKKKKVEIASHILRNYYCAFRTEFFDGDIAWCFLAKKGHQPVLI